MPLTAATGNRFAYMPFDTAFDAAHRDGLFREVGRLYREDGRLGEDWRTMLERLRSAGAANLNLGRLLEGHANAVQLLRLYGSRRQHARLEAMLEKDAILGVWGADADPPLTVAADGRGIVLHGGKRYASGLGIVSHAIVPIKREDGSQQLYCVPADDPARQNGEGWRMSGMQASASGTYDFEGLRLDADAMLGEPGDYAIEPFLQGGIWRCAAVHLGGIEAIMMLMARHLEATGRIEHPLQTERLGQAILHARTAALWVEDAARTVETVDSDDHAAIALAVAGASYTRLQVEADGLAVSEIARRAVGLSSFEAGNPLDSAVRDLAVYMRQANPDALLLHKCRVLAETYLK
ncbi:acyl-CoA dehydrogenase family protein [Pararhizobium mangrovi]|uniref:Acyl-CoA dehydrogenase n=1 Tax=Pararhizobium mangrovi TaxID=2590452 RepID=A0A506U4D3_9HYPH|nr:acyl-CoA dehydrogenase [Pararhizobium mangrovi]TPW28171.1 acyl-CoA dehydrogenase [Pararhizobium mangrovi]